MAPANQRATCGFELEQDLMVPLVANAELDVPPDLDARIFEGLAVDVDPRPVLSFVGKEDMAYRYEFIAEG